MSEGTTHTQDDRLDLAALRAAVAGVKGPAFWKSLDAIADTPAFRRFVRREYPAGAHLAAGPDRRAFFKVMAASFAMMGLAACDSTEDGRAYEVPYVRQPERIEPGATLAYASTTLLDGFANGITVTTVNGRPIKIEGNDRHPWSRGGTDIFGQASVLSLYDPMRSQTVRYLDRIADWDTFRNAMLGHVAALRADKGKGFRILTGPVTAPSTIALLESVMKGLPEAHWHMASGLGASEAASRSVFATSVATRLHFDKAKVVVAFEGDFLDEGPAQVGLARRWADARRASAKEGGLLALHAAASTPGLTSAKADFHLAVEPQALDQLVARVAAAVAGGSAPGAASDKTEAWVRRAAAALAGARGESIVTAGAMQSQSVIEAVHRLNAALGNIGKTVDFTEPVLPQAEPAAALVAAMAAGEVSTLLILDANPIYDMPGALGFGTALKKVGLKIHAGAYVDETAIRVDWHLPLAHPLESWGDARAVDGTASLVQPVIRPLFEGRTVAEIVSLLFEPQARDGLTIVKSHWQGADTAEAFEPRWRAALTDGFWPGTAATEKTVTAGPGHDSPAEAASPPQGIDPDVVTLVFRPDATIRDGTFAASSWLQELPKPLTKTTWGNVVAVSPKLAQRRRLANGDMVRVTSGDLAIEGAVWVLPGQAERTVTLTLGYGRAAPDMIFDGLGYDAGPLRPADQPWMLAGARLAKTWRKAALATTQDHATMEGHDFVRVARAGAPAPIQKRDTRSLYGAVETSDPARDGEARAWGMVIDLDACIGCNACAIACQSENNIAVVGKDQVEQGRIMHWLRIDRYYSGAKAAGPGLDDPDTHFQPVPCMHCELAPCEVGCPVEATLHDHEGLNLMVYNRCVGTRACSGYCPYKVRRFNYLDYIGGESPSIQLRNNPDVTVRARGVMEKCTYCVQRIAKARIEADKTDAPIADGMVRTACQSACPTRAITFGNLADADSAVAAAAKDPRNYDLLGELNLRPRTTYLAERAPAAGGEG